MSPAAWGVALFVAIIAGLLVIVEVHHRREKRALDRAEQEQRAALIDAFTGGGRPRRWR